MIQYFLLFLSIIFVSSSLPLAPVNERKCYSQLSWRILDSFQEGYFEFLYEEFGKRDFRRVHGSYDEWNVTWCIFFHPQRYHQAFEWQRMNNFPAIRYIAAKDNLHRQFEKAKQKYGDEKFSFWPKGFNLEEDSQFDELRQLYKNADPKNPLLYIIKRPSLPRGEGVHLIGSLEQLEHLLTPASPCYPLNKTKALAQEYIQNVLLIEGHKVTLRVYVVITSMDPLRIYIFQNGLVRICSRKYSTDLSSIGDIFAHVDSIDINHLNEHEFTSSITDKDLEYEGLRVQITHLMKRVEKYGFNGTKVWNDIEDVVVLSILSAEEEMYKEYMELAVGNRTRRLAPFEMVGFDILLDTNMKPYVLEINNSPSLSPHTKMENKIKRTLIHELFDLVDIENVDFFSIDRIAQEKWAILNRIPKNQRIFKRNGRTFDLSSIKTKEDMFLIVETELENKRKGSFNRAFPSIGGSKYLHYIFNSRNKLISDWVETEMSLDDIVYSPKKYVIS
jgi:hypothetical protein